MKQGEIWQMGNITFAEILSIQEGIATVLGYEK